MECHLSLLNQTKIDRLKISKVLLALCTKTLIKILKSRMADFSGQQLSQVASIVVSPIGIFSKLEKFPASYQKPSGR
jgi:hypothetical protein